MLAKRLMLAAGLSLSVAGLGPVAHAQTVAPAAKKETATGVKSFEAGARAFESGKFTTAIQSLSAALSAGGLSSQQMAKALYYRGAAYRKEGKTAQAISDLTSSVWLKNGLSDSERAAAMDLRQQAYRDAGLGDALPIGAAPLDAPATAASAPPVPAPAAAASTAAAASAETAASSWAVSTSEKSATEASVPAIPASNSLSAAVTAPVIGGLSASPADAPTLSALPQSSDTSSTDVAAPSLQGVGSAIGNAGSAVGSFFGNLFSGGTPAGAQATGEASSTVATASTGGWDAAAAGPAVTSNAAGPAATTDWNAGTSVAEGKASGPVRTAAVAPAKPAAAPAATVTSASGKYRLQVGVLRSRAEAEEMATKLRQSHGAKLGSAAPAIDEVVYGNMGTFYRVQVGPYASAAEPGKFCDTLKPQGYDCLVVTK